MAARAKQPPPALFDPARYGAFRFTGRELDASGRATLRYALDDELEFVEAIELPVAGRLSDDARARVDGLLALLHWVAGVSYYKTALPQRVLCECGEPRRAAAALLEALYSEGLGELAYVNRLPALPRPRFGSGRASPAAEGVREPRLANGGPWMRGRRSREPAPPPGEERPPERVLVPVGGGKDSAVALEVVRGSGCEVELFSLGDAGPIARTARVAGLPRVMARRTLDPGLRELNAAGAINGHVPVTAIVSCVALLAAAVNGFDAVAMANERSASAGNVRWDGVEVNHQFSKGLRAERLLAAAAAEATSGAVRVFSVLRPASELAIARAFARMERYHGAFTSCNAVFRSDPARRGSTWCCDCPKCRFVFLALAPFSEPEHLREVFGAELLDEERQFDGFALLTATGGHKPFECVGEEQESLAAIRLLAADRRWRDRRVVRRLVAEVLPQHPPDAGDPRQILALGDDHEVPPALMRSVRALLGA